LISLLKYPKQRDMNRVHPTLLDHEIIQEKNTFSTSIKGKSKHKVSLIIVRNVISGISLPTNCWIAWCNFFVA
jgi:hypothetical protein